MSMESIQGKKSQTAKATLSSAGKDLASETRLLSDPDSSSGGLPNGQTHQHRSGGGTTASQPTEDASSGTAGSNRCGILPEWLLFNLVIPVLLLTAAGLALCGGSGSCNQPPARAIDDTPVGRCLHLPSVNGCPVRSLARHR